MNLSRKKELIAMIANLKADGFTLQERVFKRHHDSSFAASDLTEALVRKFMVSAEDAVAIASEMMEYNLVAGDHQEHEKGENGQVCQFLDSDARHYFFLPTPEISLDLLRAELGTLQAALAAGDVHAASIAASEMEKTLSLRSTAAEQQEDVAVRLLSLAGADPNEALQEIDVDQLQVSVISADGVKEFKSASLRVSPDTISVRGQPLLRFNTCDLRVAIAGKTLDFICKSSALLFQVRGKDLDPLNEFVIAASEAKEARILSSFIHSMFPSEETVGDGAENPKQEPSVIQLLLDAHHPYSEDGQLVLQSLLCLHQVLGLHVQLCEQELRREVNAATDSATLFREGTVASALLGLLLTNSNNSFLEVTLDSVQSLPDSEETTQLLFDQICDQVGLLSSSCRHVFGSLAEIVDERFPGKSRDSLGAFFFLRFVCPALALRGQTTMSRLLQKIVTASDIDMPIVERNQHAMEELLRNIGTFDRRAGVVSVRKPAKNIQMCLTMLYLDIKDHLQDSSNLPELHRQLRRFSISRSRSFNFLKLRRNSVSAEPSPSKQDTPDGLRFKHEVLTIGGPAKWIAAKQEESEELLLFFFPGAYCDFCRKWLSEFNKHVAAMKQLGVFVCAIGSDDLATSFALSAKWQLDFPVLGDPTHEIPKLYDIVISKKRDFQHGIHHPGVVMLKKQELLYHWKMAPSAKNLFGIAGRPTVKKILGIALKRFKQ